MYKVFGLIFLITLLNSCSNKKVNEQEIDPDVVNNPMSAGKNSDTKDLPEIKFKTTIHDFGDIAEGAKATYSFKFTNTGKSDLVIANCIPSCGCTVPKFPKKPIKAGESDFIDVTFDSKGRSGTFTKDITIYSNTIPNSIQIFIKGNVKK